MLSASFIEYYKTGYFSKIIVDYLSSGKDLKPCYHYNFSLESFHQIIADKSEEKINRSLLVTVLKEQYNKIRCNDAVTENINSLSDNKTFTVTTGHQLCLFTGPLYFIYKIFSTINLAEQLSRSYPGYRFVPVYWMVSEDHDFEEINHIHLYGKKLKWEGNFKCPSGRIPVDSIEQVINKLEEIIGNNNTNAKSLLNLFRESYLGNPNMANATRYLINELFGEWGLVILNPDDTRLKQIFAFVLKDDIVHQTNFKLVNDAINELKKRGYSAQVNPREINVFYLTDDIRSRIIKQEKRWQVLETDLLFSEQELAKEINLNSLKFGPNVILRPLFQEMILPNLAYVGGAAEIAYWLEFKKMFEHHNVNFPLLVLRNSLLWVDKISAKNMLQLDINEDQLFKNTDQLVNEYVKKNSSGAFSLGKEKDVLNNLFEKLVATAQSVDPTLKNLVIGEGIKQQKILDNIEQKFLKAEKNKFEVQLNQIRKLKDKLFPENILQERYSNFIPFYLEHGKNYFSILKNVLNPFEKKFTILK